MSLTWLTGALAELTSQDLRRRLLVHDGQQAAVLKVDGRRVINFGSNDYLGLAADVRLAAAATRAAARSGWGAGSSPLVTGYAREHADLAAALAEFEGTEAALLFPSGYAANAATVPALVDQHDAIFADALNHASLIDGCRLSRAAVHVYPHGDCDALARLLRQSTAARRLIVTDSLFSMDGDQAPLATICDLAEQHGAMVLVDEAHATGVFGAHGRGVAEAQGVEERVHVRIGTLSKALGSAGGFVCGSQLLIDWLLNRARAYIFSTASPPAVSAAAQRALQIARDEPLRRTDLLSQAATLRERLHDQGWDTKSSTSQIIPLVIGSAAEAVSLSTRLLEKGLLVPAIRPPSVPAGSARLRISLTAGHTPAMIDELLSALAEARRHVQR